MTNFRISIAAYFVFAAILSITATPSAFALAGKTIGEIPVTGISNPALQPLDALMISFVAEHDVPGAALAVTKDGRLVYARGFGYADREARLPVQPDSLFRIASLSKSLTAAAVFKLIEQNKLNLDTAIFPYLNLISEKLEPADPRLKEITIQHLLNHTGGWDSQKSFDPMFRSIQIAKAMHTDPPAKPLDIALYMVTQKLQFDPGSRYAYSNFGYSLLGLAIEQASGQAYSEFVQKSILSPLNIKAMRLGRTLLEDRAPNEVRYYANARMGPAVVGTPLGRNVSLPYGTWCLESMDSHGGWLASAVDLVRFAAAFDDREHCPILNPQSVDAMFSRPPGPPGFKEDGKPRDSYYACGWMVRPVGKDGKENDFHTGALDGTSTLLVRRFDGLNWAVFFNARSDPLGKNLADAIDGLVHRAVDQVRVWPREDLFKKY